MNNLESIKESISRNSPSYIDLCSDFLILYSRFEYALKECGFLQNGNRVLASIENYAESINEIFRPEPESKLEKAVDFIIEYPPKTQIKIRTNLIWQDNPKEGNSIQVLPEYLRRVRNNLLHGGKFYGRIETGSRNWNLVLNSMIIIEHWIDLSDNVKGKFREF